MLPQQKREQEKTILLRVYAAKLFHSQVFLIQVTETLLLKARCLTQFLMLQPSMEI